MVTAQRIPTWTSGPEAPLQGVLSFAIEQVAKAILNPCSPGIKCGVVMPLGRGALVAEAGTATISQYATTAGIHFSVDVAVGGESLGTEQLIVDDLNNTSIAANTSTNVVRTWSVALPDGQAALNYSRSLIGADTGAYNSLTNSCLS